MSMQEKPAPIARVKGVNKPRTEPKSRVSGESGGNLGQASQSPGDQELSHYKPPEETILINPAPDEASPTQLAEYDVSRAIGEAGISLDGLEIYLSDENPRVEKNK